MSVTTEARPTESRESIQLSVAAGAAVIFLAPIVLLLGVVGGLVASAWLMWQTVELLDGISTQLAVLAGVAVYFGFWVALTWVMAAILVGIRALRQRREPTMVHPPGRSARNAT